MHLMGFYQILKERTAALRRYAAIYVIRCKEKLLFSTSQLVIYVGESASCCFSRLTWKMLSWFRSCTQHQCDMLCAPKVNSHLSNFICGRLKGHTVPDWQPDHMSFQNGFLCSHGDCSLGKCLFLSVTCELKVVSNAFSPKVLLSKDFFLIV